MANSRLLDKIQGGKEMNKRAIIYIRVSTDEQAEHGFSLQSQLDACHKYALDRNYKIVAEFSDDYSGREIDRPGLNELRNLIGTSQIDALIIYSGDRLTRDLAHSLELRRELSLFDVELCKVLGGQVDDSPHGRFTENVIGAASQLESEMIVERSQRGKNQRAKEGHIIHHGYPPYGYDRIGSGRDAKYVINEYEANIVNQMFEWYTGSNGQEDPKTLRGIATHLNDIGVPPPNKRANATTLWHPVTVRKILHNEIYIGTTYWGKSRVVNKKRVFLPREKWIPIDVPELAFIDPEMFDVVKRKAKRNLELSKRNRKGEYLLVGFFRCGHCGSTVCGHSRKYKSGNVGYYYRCGNHWRQFMGEEKCGIKHIDTVQYKIDNAVWDWIKNLLSDKVALEAGLDEMESRKADEIEPMRQRLENIDAMIKETKDQMRRIIREMAQHDDEIILDAFRHEIDQYSSNIDALQVEHERIVDALSTVELTDIQKDRILDTASKIIEGLDIAKYEDKRKVLEILNVQVTIYYDEHGKRVEVTCAISEYNDVIMLHPSKARPRGQATVDRRSQGSAL